MKLIFCIFTGLLICTSNLSAQDRYKKAYDEYMNGDLRKSVELFKECIRNGEDTVHSYLYLAGANIFLGNYDDAMSGLNKVSQISDTIFKLHFYYGKLYLLLGKYDKAIESYTAELVRYPNHAGSYDDRGCVKGILGDFSGALADHTKAIELDPKAAESYSNRGYLFLKLRQYDKALEDLTTSINIEPTQKAYSNRGVVYFLIDSNDLAIKDYTHALKLLPNDGETLYLRGVSYKKIKMRGEACADFKRSLSLGYKGAKEMVDEMACK